MAEPTPLQDNAENTVYAAVGCNPTPHCADWGDNGLIIFGAHNTVAILDPNFNGAAKITKTYTGHEARVNTVRWLRSTTAAPETYFISGADDYKAFIWQHQTTGQRNDVHRYEALKHGAPVTDITTLQLTNNNKWLIATAADQTVTLWAFDTQNVVMVQTINNRNSYTLGLSLFRLPKSEQLLLAFGNEKGNIILWAQDKPFESTSNENEPFFRFILQMSGHEDWVRALDVVEDGDDILLASAAQDNFIRLWRISNRTAEQARKNIVDICNVRNDDGGEIRVEERILHLSATNWCAISLESVLYGHEGWIYGVNWHKSKEHGIRLLSVSIDKSIIIWAPSEDGIWMEQVRVGEVGGNSLGFYGGKFSSNGKAIFGHSYQGGFHIWHQAEDNERVWTPGVIVGGHFDEVRDLAWAPNGEYLLTVSADQTSRIHAPWRRDVNASIENVTWHELARPQVHGYDMQTLAILTRYKFASGAEEKIVRTFQASANFIENFRRITKTQRDDAEGDALLETLPKGASVPSLGLSNKAVYNVDIESVSHEKHVKDEYPENYFTPITLDAPPQEETLMQNTLWPEMQKLYGHGFEIYALAATTDGKVLASACRATNDEHAQIILWDTASWKQIQKLPAHKLTITQMRFSPNGQYLLSVSRDRTWTLFERDETQTIANNQSFYCVKQRAAANKMSVHNRIIWTCDWSHDGKYFATGGRDGVLGIWSRSQRDEWSIGWKETYANPVTAVAFARSAGSSSIYQLAVGFSNGDILLQQLQETNAAADGFQLQVIDKTQLTLEKAHDSTVKRLQFRPAPNSKGDSTTDCVLLASCGEDHFVKIFKYSK